LDKLILLAMYHKYIIISYVFLFSNVFGKKQTIFL